MCAVTTGISRTDVSTRSADEVRRDERDAARRADAWVQVTFVTLLAMVTISLLLGWRLTGRGSSDGTDWAAAGLALLLPFVGAVIATRNHMPVLGGVYVVVTLGVAIALTTVIPAVGFLR
jgi:hypothetical protein